VRGHAWPTLVTDGQASAQTGDPRYLGQQLRAGQPQAAPGPWHGQGHENGPRRALPAKCLPGGCSWPDAWLGADQLALLRRTR